jgi:hypothetical protein
VIEEQKILEDHDPLRAGFARPDRHRCSVAVQDGLLEIELVARSMDPKVSALEVEWAD